MTISSMRNVATPFEVNSMNLLSRLTSNGRELGRGNGRVQRGS
jgi:hypothetical protein